MIRRVSSVFLVVVALLVCFALPASAQKYSTDYPQIGNSGSPYWIHCEIRDMGDFLIVLDPNINPQSFGFDTPKNGYNLINNTGSVIKGRAYSTSGSNAAYLVQFPSYYRITMQTGYDAKGQQTVYEDHKILNIYGTSLDLIDYTGDRGNDAFKYDLERPELVTVIVLVIIVFVLVYQFHFKSRLFRM